MTTGGGMGGAADVLFIDVTARLEGFDARMNEVERRAEETGQKAGGKLGSALSLGMKVAAGAAVVAVAAIGTAALAAGQEVEVAMGTIRAGTGATGEALAALRTDFEKVAANAPESLNDVAKVLADLNTRTGLTGEGLQDLTTQMLNLARVSGDDVNSLVANTTRLFGDWSIATEDQAGTLDKLWKVSQNTGIGVDELAQKVVQFGAPLRQMGFSLEESTALLGKFEKEGVNGELVMSSLRIALGQTAKESEKLGKYQEQAADIQAKLTKEVKKNGDETATATRLKNKLAEAEDKINFALSASDAPKALRERMELIKSLGTVSERNAAAMELFGAKAGPDMAAAIYEGRFEIDELLKTLDSSGETIKKASDDIKTLPQQFAELKNATTLALAPLGQLALNGIKPLIPIIASAIQVGSQWIKTLSDSGRVQEIVKSGLATLSGAYNTAKNVYAQVSAEVGKLTSFLNKNKEILIPLAAGVAAGATAFGLYRLAVTAVSIATAAWTTVTTIATGASVALRAALTFITGPVGLVIAAITLLVGAGVYLYRNWDEVKAKAIAVWGSLRAIVVGAMDSVTSFLRNIDLKQIGLSIVQGLANGIRAGVGAVGDAARNLGQSIIGGVKGILNIQSPSVVMFSAGENVGQGLANGITKSSPAVQKAAARMAASVIEEVEAARKALESEISTDKWVASLNRATTAQLTAAQARARAAGEADKYRAITGELERREDFHTAAVKKNSEAVAARTAEVDSSRAATIKAAAEQLAANRAQIIGGEQQERYAAGLRSNTSAQLAAALATARTGGEVQKYNTIKAEQARREADAEKKTDDATAALNRQREAAKAAADQLTANRKAITDGVAFDAYVDGLAGYTDAMLDAARSNAEAAGNGAKYNAVLSQQRTNAEGAAQAISDLVDAQIKASNSRFSDTQGATDSAYRQTYGAGDVGLIRSLAATTGLSVGRIRADVQAALDDAKRFAPEAARVIERVYADALAHRKTVTVEQGKLMEQAAKDEEDRIQRVLAAYIYAADERRKILEADTAEESRLNAAINDGYTEESQNRTNLIKARFTTEEEAKSAAFEAEVAEALRVDGLISANYAEESQNRLALIKARFTAEEDAKTAAFEAGLAEDARIDAAINDAYTQASLTRIQLIKDEAAAAEEAVPDFQALRKELELQGRPLTDLIALAKQYAAGVGDGADAAGTFLIGVEDVEAINGAYKAWLLNLDRIGQGEWVKGLKDLSDAELQAGLDAARASENVREFNALLAEIGDREINVTVKVGGLDTGLKALDLYKSAIEGVGGVVTSVFTDLVAGTSSGVDSILKNMALMALGIVKQVAVSIAAYQAQAIALAIISGASFNFVQAGLALAAAAAVAGIVAGLESRLKGSGATAGRTATSTASRAPIAQSAAENGSLSIPNSSVTLIAAPEWTAIMSRAVDKFDAAVDRFSSQGVRVQSTVAVESRGGLGAFALTTP